MRVTARVLSPTEEWTPLYTQGEAQKDPQPLILLASNVLWSLDASSDSTHELIQARISCYALFHSRGDGRQNRKENRQYSTSQTTHRTPSRATSPYLSKYHRMEDNARCLLAETMAPCSRPCGSFGRLRMISLK